MKLISGRLVTLIFVSAVASLPACGGLVKEPGVGNDNATMVVADDQGYKVYLPIVIKAETPITVWMYGYWVSNFITTERDTIKSVLDSLASSFHYMERLEEITKDLTAPNAYYLRADEILRIDSKTIQDGTLDYVLAHEISHAWSYQHGGYTYLGIENSRFVGPDFAGGWFFLNDIVGYERCYPCTPGITRLEECYAASNAEAALALGPQLTPEGWANMMGLLDEDFCETVAAYYGYKPDVAWLDQNLSPCTPTERFNWLNYYLDNPEQIQQMEYKE